MRNYSNRNIWFLERGGSSCCRIFFGGQVGDGTCRGAGNILFLFKFQKDNITALTYQHRNDQCTACLESRRARRVSARSEDAPIRCKEQGARGPRRGRPGTLEGRAATAVALFVCYRTIYNISLIRRSQFRLRTTARIIRKLCSSIIGLFHSHVRSLKHARTLSLFLSLSLPLNPPRIRLTIITIR